jgi:hypothetical protein
MEQTFEGRKRKNDVMTSLTPRQEEHFKKLAAKTPSPCLTCGLPYMEFREGWIDPCIGKLPGVIFACCGHGQETGYIAFENGTVIRFKDCKVEREESVVKPFKDKSK